MIMDPTMENPKGMKVIKNSVMVISNPP